MPMQFRLLFRLPLGLHVAEFSTLAELPELARELEIDHIQLVAAGPIQFARMAQSLDLEIGPPLDPPEEWDKVLEIYQEALDETSPEEWEEYRSARRAFETSYWPPRVTGSVFCWVARQTSGKLLGVRLDLLDMRFRQKEILP